MVTKEEVVKVKKFFYYFCNTTHNKNVIPALSSAKDMKIYAFIIKTFELQTTIKYCNDIKLCAIVLQ